MSAQHPPLRKQGRIRSSSGPSPHWGARLPDAQGLYDPAFERDACGIGFIARINGEASHDMVRDGLRILRNLTHRGATGADAHTGDGAGILLQMPDRFLRDAVDGFCLPDPGDYGAGLVFLPCDARHRAEVVAVFERIVREEGLVPLGWRTVPTDPSCLGEAARLTAPVVEQVFIGRGTACAKSDFERVLLVVRKRVERFARGRPDPDQGCVHIPSLSSRTLVYKGLLLADQIDPFFPDLSDESMASALAMVHQRFSTNTFPTWDLAQPFRVLCHNGEINTLRCNLHAMEARESRFSSERFGPSLPELLPVCTPGASDSAMLDNAAEWLLHTGRSLPHAVLMLVPEAWEKNAEMSEERKAFYEYHACLMEPWDGPAALGFTDGSGIGAVLDRNGLRPARYVVTHDGRVILASESGVLDVAPENTARRGRLEPGRMLWVDLNEKRIVDDDEIKDGLARRRPYGAWLRTHLRRFSDVPPADPTPPFSRDEWLRQSRMFGYSREDIQLILSPMAKTGVEPVGSMGTDTPLAVLSDHDPLLFDYFHQLFAQVTNPPLDAIRESLVTSLDMYLGPEGNLFEETPEQAGRLHLPRPVLDDRGMAAFRALDSEPLRAQTLATLFETRGGAPALERALEDVCASASRAVEKGATLLVLSDRGADRRRAPIPSLLAVSAVHHHLIREGRRTRCSLIVESGEPREPHHCALLFGYGASAVHPYLALETVRSRAAEGEIEGVTERAAQENVIRALCYGVQKIMSKMGMATLRGYAGAQIFEAVGLRRRFADRYFTGTASRIEGIDIDDIARESLRRHRRAFPNREPAAAPDLDDGGRHQWRRGGEAHLLDPLTIARLQQAVRHEDGSAYTEFARLINESPERRCTLRGLLRFRPAEAPVPIQEVEPWTDLVRRFKTGAMSYGSISREAHETLALAMNELGGCSNSGEGGEDADRYGPDPRGHWRRSAIKQVASGRFGVTIDYLVNAREIQIKIAQGAKPGEGGQLPGFKVYPWIARTRHSTPYVTLLSPPPHHDIYSIEDLAQLVYDLKNANPDARVDVKLVSAAGVGTVAAGVAKAKADLVLISGYDGGTGAAPLSSMKHAGLPWELGLSETHQTLVLNRLRSRIAVECDGKLLTGRDVAVACLLGAEEFGFSAGPLVSLGCVMMRVCHLNTCPVGIATQDPELRRRFAGKPEHVIAYFRFVAEELRGIMAELGFRTLPEMIGRTDRLEPDPSRAPAKARGIDLSPILYAPDTPSGAGGCREAQDHELERIPDRALIEHCEPALERGEPVHVTVPIRNVNRTFGTLLSGRIARYYGAEGLPRDTIVIDAVGSAGQSFGAFGAAGLTLRVKGDANDFFGKGLSGAVLVIRPPDGVPFVAEENILIGNVALYGATIGQAFIRGRAGERFAVRNSGAQAVVEGVGDHGCEYMTGGRVVILGRTGRNFAAGMSGGIAYVLDESGDFSARRCNTEMVELERIETDAEAEEVRALIASHAQRTESPVAARIRDEWIRYRPLFVKVMPIEYRRALALLAGDERAGAEAGE